MLCISLFRYSGSHENAGERGCNIQDSSALISLSSRFHSVQLAEAPGSSEFLNELMEDVSRLDRIGSLPGQSIFENIDTDTSRITRDEDLR